MACLARVRGKTSCLMLLTVCVFDSRDDSKWGKKEKGDDTIYSEPFVADLPIKYRSQHRKQDGDKAPNSKAVKRGEPPRTAAQSGVSMPRLSIWSRQILIPCFFPVAAHYRSSRVGRGARLLRAEVPCIPDLQQTVACWPSASAQRETLAGAASAYF